MAGAKEVTWLRLCCCETPAARGTKHLIICPQAALELSILAPWPLICLHHSGINLLESPILVGPAGWAVRPPHSALMWGRGTMTSDYLTDSMIPAVDTEKLSRKLSYHSKLRLQEHKW